jgi:hypothetical protein
MFSVYILTLIIISSLLFFQLQAKIEEEQRLTRIQFVKYNPHLEIYFRQSSYYREFYSSVYPIKTVKYTGGMTDEQKKKFLDEMWAKHITKVKRNS